MIAKAKRKQKRRLELASSTEVGGITEVRTNLLRADGAVMAAFTVTMYAATPEVTAKAMHKVADALSEVS